AFGDLEIEVSRWQAARLERLLDHGQPAIVLQLLHRQVHRQAQHHVLAVPGHQLPAGVAQHACTEGLDHPRLLGDGDELGRADDSALGVAPAQQRLDAERAAGIHVDLWLIDEEELVVHEAATHVGLELQPRLNPRVHVGGIEAVGVAPRFLRRVHRRVRLFDDPVRIGCIDRVYRHADRAGQRWSLVDNAKRRQERLADARKYRHYLEGGVRGIEAWQDQNELVAA